MVTAPADNDEDFGENQPTSFEAQQPLSEFLSSYVSHNFLLRSLRGPDGYIGHWG